MMWLLIGLFWLVPAVFSSTNISETEEEMATFFIGNSSTNIPEAEEEVATFFIGRIIYTKWCGPGNDANAYSDLGENRDIDICCRDHDNCDLFVESGITKYGFKNDGLYTVSSCKCDDKFRECLGKLNSWVANLVMKLYAFTNQKCLVNWCELPYVRCPRNQIHWTRIESLVFEGIEMSNDTNTLNQLIRDGMKNEQKATASESIKNQRSHVQSTDHSPVQNHPWPFYHHKENPHHVPYYVPYLVRSHAQSNQRPYPESYPWQLQQVDYLAAPQSGHLQYLPNQQQSDIICCVDEYQQL